VFSPVLIFGQKVEIKPVSLWMADACYALASQGNYLFVGSNNRVYIFEFGESELKSVSFCPVDSVVNSLFVQDNYLYVADRYIGLIIFDLSEIQKPKLISYYCGPGVSHDVWINNQTAFLAVDNFGVEIIDLSNPLQPKKMVRIPTLDETWAVTGYHNYLFTANYRADLKIFDLSDLQQPKVLSSVSNLNGLGLGLYLNWPYLYAAIGDSGLQIIDVSEPSQPKILGRCPRSISSPFVFTCGIKVINSYAFVADMAGLQIIDVSNPHQPKQIGYHSTMADGVAVTLEVMPTKNQNEYLVYLSLGGSGLKILKVKIGGK
jgi:hypothetical protein